MSGNTTSLLFDMRAPDFGAPARELYPAALGMAEFADRIGIDRIGVMEHHGSEDGYLPAPFVLGAAVAAQTSRVRISLGAVILPLHDPVKIAEQIAVLDLLSGGRLEVILGAGYVPSEFALFNVSLSDRGKLLDQGIEIIIRSLKGERFKAYGREVFVRPLPLQRPEDILMGGGGVAASAKRAGRFGIGFAPLHPAFDDLYIEECRRHGHDPGRIHHGGLPLAIHVAEDPEALWPEVGRHFLHMAASYAQWAKEEGAASNSPFVGMDTIDKIRVSGIFAIWTPEQLLAEAPSIIGRKSSLNFMPLIGGLSPETGWKSLRLVAERVIPHLPKAQER